MAQTFSWAVSAEPDTDTSPPKRPTDKPLLSLAPAVELRELVADEASNPALLAEPGAEPAPLPSQEPPVWSELSPDPEQLRWPAPTTPAADPNAADSGVVSGSGVESEGLHASDVVVDQTRPPDETLPDSYDTELFDQSAPDAAPSGDSTRGADAAFTVTRAALAVAQVLDGVPVLVSVNPAFRELTGLAAQDVLGGDALPMHSPDCDPAALDQLRRAMEGTRTELGTGTGSAASADVTFTSALLCERTNGMSYWAEITVSLVGVLVIIEQQDLTEQLAAEAEHWRARHVDPVTGSAARVLAEQAVDGLVAAGQPFALLLVRITGVKQRNREGGYAAGDDALADTANRMVAVLAGRGRVARHVGTQFVVVVTDLGADGRGLSHDLADELELAASQDGLSAYAGTALFPTDADTSRELLDVARSQFETVRRQSRTRRGRLAWRLQWMMSQSR